MSFKTSAIVKWERDLAHDRMGRRIDPSWGGPIELLYRSHEDTQEAKTVKPIHRCLKLVRLLYGSSVVRAFAHDAMGCRIDPSWGGPIELLYRSHEDTQEAKTVRPIHRCLKLARLLYGSSVVRAFAHDAMGCRIDPSWGGPIELLYRSHEDTQEAKTVRPICRLKLAPLLNPSWGESIELFLVPASAGVTKAVVCAILIIIITI